MRIIIKYMFSSKTKYCQTEGGGATGCEELSWPMGENVVKKQLLKLNALTSLIFSRISVHN